MLGGTFPSPQVRAMFRDKKEGDSNKEGERTMGENSRRKQGKKVELALQINGNVMDVEMLSAVTLRVTNF